MTFKYFVPIWVWVESDKKLKNEEVIFFKPKPNLPIIKVTGYQTQKIERLEDEETI